MGRITELLHTAQQRAGELRLPYVGALLPHEAYELLRLAPGARLIDVRSRAEIDFNGAPVDAVHVEWQSWPGWVANPHFLTQLKQAADPEALLLFLCRSGLRGHKAAAAATEAGLSSCYNILEGFEGDLDKTTGHRNELGGWKKRGLPWKQS